MRKSIERTASNTVTMSSGLPSPTLSLSPTATALSDASALTMSPSSVLARTGNGAIVQPVPVRPLHSPISNGATNPTSKKWASDEDWVAYKDIIVQLYLEENRFLKDVMHIMETEHHFFAT